MIGKFVRDRAGGVVVYAALLAPVLVGVAGLAIDAGVWYAQAREAQSAADSAAVAGALEILRSKSDPAKVAAAVHQDLLAYGFAVDNGDGITVNFPPASGPNAGAMDKVEVILARGAQRTLSALYLAESPNVTARAVGVSDIDDTCVWSLNPTESATVNISGTADVNLGCGVFVNSNHPAAALNEGGSGCLTATKIKVVGGASGDCLVPAPLTGASPVVDPLASLQAPPYAPGVCDHTGNIIVNSGEIVTLSPGTYCGKIKVVSDATLVFQPGLYILENSGTLEFGGQAVVTGTDVNFYLTPNNSQDLTITGGASITLSAPDDGPLPGILFYHDRNSVSTITHKLTGGGDMQLEGIIYFPNQDLQFAGGANLDSSTSLLIADTVSFTGNTDIGDFDGSVASANPLLITGGLVE